MDSGCRPGCQAFSPLQFVPANTSGGLAPPAGFLLQMRSTSAAQLLLALILGVIIAFAPSRDERGSLFARAGTVPLDSRGTEAGPEPVRPRSVTLSVRSEAAIQAEDALMVLSPLVAASSHPKALESAFKAYFNYREAHPEDVRTPYLYFVDFGLGNLEPRGYVFDMDALRLVEGPFTVAAGSGSGSDDRGVPVEFSNREGSNATSLGLFVTRKTYDFRGKSNGRPYRSIGLRIEGVSDGFNDAALERGVVIHGAPYVTANRAGRSEGCPAMEPERAERLLPMLAEGSLVFQYSPNDREWATEEPWTQPELDYLLKVAAR